MDDFVIDPPRDCRRYRVLLWQRSRSSLQARLQSEFCSALVRDRLNRRLGHGNYDLLEVRSDTLASLPGNQRRARQRFGGLLDLLRLGYFDLLLVDSYYSIARTMHEVYKFVDEARQLQTRVIPVDIRKELSGHESF